MGIMRGVKLATEIRTTDGDIVDLKNCVAWSIENTGETLVKFSAENEGVGIIDLPKGETREFMGVSGYIFLDRIKLYFEGVGKNRVSVIKFIESNTETVS